MFRFSTTTTMLALALLANLTPHLAAQSDTSLGTVRPQVTRKASSIAVLNFRSTTPLLQSETIPRIVRNDLELSGLFKTAGDMNDANRQLSIEDRSPEGFNPTAWKALGFDHTIRGMVEEDGPNLVATVRWHDVASGRQIFERKITQPKARARDLAHNISDATMKFVHNVDPIFNTKLLYVTERVPGSKEIGIMDADGFNARAITKHGKLATMPTWGSNGAEFYYMSYHGNRANVYGQQLDYDASMNLIPKGAPWLIAAYGGTNHSPAWNQPTRRIALVLSKDGNSELYSSARDGSDLRRLTTTTFTEGSPTWSPDGTKIAFTTNEAGGVHLFMANADGSNRTRLTTRGSWNDAVSWSPKGDKLAFASRNAGVNDIYTYDLNTKTYQRLTMSQGNNESPAWAPNGVHLAFSSNRTGQWQIYIMLDDGQNQRPLTTTGRNTLADWGPNPK